MEAHSDFRGGGLVQPLKAQEPTNRTTCPIPITTYRSHKSLTLELREEAELEVQRALWIRPHGSDTVSGMSVMGQEVGVCDMAS